MTSCSYKRSTIEKHKCNSYISGFIKAIDRPNDICLRYLSTLRCLKTNAISDCLLCTSPLKYLGLINNVIGKFSVN